ncbi:MAG: serine/threonine-protein phosphatase [Candidatus Riflebacteria bacterium]|nr:serine/threonine-protein phosphatase [Candidatus Riflebacteria bacterium]
MVEADNFISSLPEGLQKTLKLSERVFCLGVSKSGVIEACSESLRKILAVPEMPVGNLVEEIFLPAATGASRLTIADIAAAGETGSLLARLAMSNRPCRLIVFRQGEGYTCWGEVIGDKSTTGLSEVSGMAGQIQELLKQIKKQHDELQQGLKTAAWLQHRFLPTARKYGDVSAAWHFRPCEKIGGDYFNIFIKRDGSLAAYLLDVSGHGMASAMLGIAATQYIRQTIDGFENDDLQASIMPQLLAKLEQEFPLERFNLYFSMIYLEIDHECRQMKWINAGHPDPILLRNGEAPLLLKGGGPFVGLDQAELVDEQQIELKPGDRIYLYSDGITERRSHDGGFFGEKLLMESLARENQQPLQKQTDAVIADNDTYGAPLPPQDDITLVGLETGADS